MQNGYGNSGEINRAVTLTWIESMISVRTQVTWFVQLVAVRFHRERKLEGTLNSKPPQTRPKFWGVDDVNDRFCWKEMTSSCGQLGAEESQAISVLDNL